MLGILVALTLSGPELGPATLELRALKAADQAVRQFSGVPTMAEIHRMEAGDHAREERVRQLLRQDLARTGEDLDNAALILQHGGDPDDYELARELSILAFAKGKRGTLQTAAEDRFLLSIRRSQRFGNQFSFRSGGKLEFQKLDEAAPAAVSETLRAEFLLAPVAKIREKGLKAIGEEIPRLVEQWKKRTAPEWIAEQDRRPVSLELSRLAARSAGKDFDYRTVSRVFEIYRQDQLATPRNFHHAAVVLATSSEDRTLLLANELAALAVSRGRADARRTFVETWDKFLVVIGKPDRYGTISGVHRVSPIVAREFSLNSIRTSNITPKPVHSGSRHK